MCPWKERQGKELLFTIQEILKKDDKTEEDFFLKGTVVCMKTLIVTRTSMELQEKVVR